MKHKVIIIYCLFLSGNIFGQSKDKQGHAVYQVSRNTNTKQANLYFDSKSSIYIFNYNSTEDLSSSKRNDLHVFKDFQSQKMITDEVLYNEEPCVVNDSLPKLKWILTKERKMIAGFNCQKATTKFRCADYTAWFTTSIPTSAGPWKLGGLPGLILEMVNETVNEKFVATSVKYPSDPNKTVPINFPASKHRTFNSYKDFGKVQTEERRKFIMFMKSKNDMPANAEIKIEERECY